ncbi:MAG TPA: type III-B CRISPR module-associated Cmr3 family protein [Pirellulales bacterium]|nr:type III-B CRISPR module-associated Cmr3 family protein [Pirellulales bacterium]
MSERKAIGLVLDPLDVLFFRDGRAFDAAASVGGGLPLPQTLAGALTTALLRRHDCDFDVLGKGIGDGCDWPDAVARACPRAPWIAAIGVRGPWLARRAVAEFARSQAGAAATFGTLASPAMDFEPLVPAPATLHQLKKRDDGPLVALRPLAADVVLPGWKESHRGGLRPLWRRGQEPTEAAQGFLTSQGLRAFLSGGEVHRDELLKSDDLYQFDHRTGIEIDADRLTATESKIYGAQFLSLARNVRFAGPSGLVVQASRLPASAEPAGSPHHTQAGSPLHTRAGSAHGDRRDLACDRDHAYDICFYAELVLPAEAPPNALDEIDSLPFGGEGRRVALHQTNLFDWPAAPAIGGDQKPLVFLTTPGMFAAGWKPRVLDGHLVAAAVPGDVPVSGWDLARRGPKPTRFAAAAGSVYFLDRIPSDLPDSLSDDARDRRQGWGCYLKGVWSDDQR